MNNDQKMAWYEWTQATQRLKLLEERELGHRLPMGAFFDGLRAAALTADELGAERERSRGVVDFAAERARRTGQATPAQVPPAGPDVQLAVDIDPARIERLAVALSPVAEVPLTVGDVLRRALLEGLAVLDREVAGHE